MQFNSNECILTSRPRVARVVSATGAYGTADAAIRLSGGLPTALAAL